jgi:hypothetical protein
MSAIACKSPSPDEQDGKRAALSEMCSWVMFHNVAAYRTFLYSYTHGKKFSSAAPFLNSSWAVLEIRLASKTFAPASLIPPGHGT